MPFTGILSAGANIRSRQLFVFQGNTLAPTRLPGNEAKMIVISCQTLECVLLLILNEGMLW
jgi:hypothetical protein